MAVPSASYAVGTGNGGGIGFGSLNFENYNIEDLGPLSGTWQIAGGTDAFASVLNNPSPNMAGHGVNTSVSMGSVYLRVDKPTGLLQFRMNAGLIQDPVMGLTTNNGAFNSVAPYGSAYNPLSPPVVSWWITLQPSPYWDISAGKQAPVEGIEGIVGFTNPTFFVSGLNAMQLVSGYGPQLDLYYGPATFNLQWSDADNTHRMNIVTAALTYNLNQSGTDFLMAFGHTNLGHTGNPGQPHAGVGFGFNQANSSLIGGGGQFFLGKWMIVPEAQFQWLPKSSVSGSSNSPRPLTTYYEASAMTDFTYQFAKEWTATFQPEYIYQKGDKNDPNQNLFGNFLQAGSPLAPGSFSPGMSMLGLQANVTWQRKNIFVEPTVAYTHLAGIQSGTGYGVHGNANDQVVAVLDIGFLIGKY